MTPAEVHNRDVGGIIRAIVRPTLDAGGDANEILVLLESVVAGVLLFAVRDGGDDLVLDEFVDRVRDRLVELRSRPEVPLN